MTTHHTTESVERRTIVLQAILHPWRGVVEELAAERDALRARLDEAERAFLWIMEQDCVGSGMIRDEGRFAKRARAFLNGGGNG